MISNPSGNAPVYHEIVPATLTLATAGAWTDLDISSKVPAGTVAILAKIQFTNAGQTEGLRQVGSSSQVKVTCTLATESYTLICPVVSSHIEYYKTAMACQILGYWL